MNGVWIVETENEYDYVKQVAAFDKESKAKEYAEWYSNKYRGDTWIRFYRFGEVFAN